MVWNPNGFYLDSLQSILFTMVIMKKSISKYSGIMAILFFMTSCSGPLDWPASPLYTFEQEGSNAAQPADLESARKAIVGHYAHYDVVAYEDTTTRTTMRSFIISYGFTDYYLEEGKLMQSDRFMRAEQKLSRKNARSIFSDEAVQAIKPRVQEVELTQKEGIWHIHRPETPSLLGTAGDPTQPLSTDPTDPNLTDPDQDGHPGVTVHISVGKFFKGEIYITRREIFSNYLTLNNDGSLSGYVIDRSEQFVVGASKKILTQESNSIQHPDRGLSPILLVPVDPNIDTLEELMQIRDEIFPEEPEFN
jgi:hypothetical protein